MLRRSLAFWLVLCHVAVIDAFFQLSTRHPSASSHAILQSLNIDPPTPVLTRTSQLRLQFQFHLDRLPRTDAHAETATGRALRGAIMQIQDRDDQPLGQVTVRTLTLQDDQWIQLGWSMDSETETETPLLSATHWKRAESQENTVDVRVDTNGHAVFFLNGRKLSLLPSLITSPAKDTEYAEDLEARRPAEWDEIEQDPELIAHDGTPIQLHWQPPFVKLSNHATLPVQNKQASRLVGKSLHRLLFTPDVFRHIEASRHSHGLRLALRWPTRCTKEQGMWTALVLGFAGYLIMMAVLAQMSSIRPRRKDTSIRKLTKMASVEQLMEQSDATPSQNTPATVPLRKHRSSQLALLDSVAPPSHIPLSPRAHCPPPSPSQKSAVYQLNMPSMPSLTFTLSDNRHILFPSKLRDLQK